MKSAEPTKFIYLKMWFSLRFTFSHSTKLQRYSVRKFVFKQRKNKLKWKSDRSLSSTEQRSQLEFAQAQAQPDPTMKN